MADGRQGGELADGKDSVQKTVAVCHQASYLPDSINIQLADLAI